MADVPCDRVVISGLPAKTDRASVVLIFGAYGNIKTVRMIPGKNAAVVQFQTLEDAVWVVENLHGNLAKDLTEPVNCVYAGEDATPKPSATEAIGKAVRSQPYGGAGTARPATTWQPQGMVPPAQAQGAGAARRPVAAWQSQGMVPPALGGAAMTFKGSRSEQPDSVPGGGKGEVATWQGSGSVQILKKGLNNANVLPGAKWCNDANALFVSGLPVDTTDQDLYEIFSPFGAIPTKGVRAMVNEDGTCKGYGYVNFNDNEPTQTAVNVLHGTIMPSGMALNVRAMRREPGAPTLPLPM